MAKEKSLRQVQMRARIAAAAARLMAEDGIDDFAFAKRKAARSLGVEETTALPGNQEIEAELRTYLSLYQGDEQRERLRALRSAAASIMRELAEFKPYIVGPVLSGIAGRYADIDLQLFTDGLKTLELFFLNRGIAYEAAEHRHYCGHEPRLVSTLSFEWNGFPVRATVYSAKDERNALKTSVEGKALARAPLSVIMSLLAGT